MSKTHRAALEEVQSEASRVRAKIRALEARFQTALGLAEEAEAELSVAQVPLEALHEKNRSLHAQIKWENGGKPIPPVVGILVALAVVGSFLAALIR